MGSRRECTRILGLEGFRVEAISWEGDAPSARVRITIERRGLHPEAIRVRNAAYARAIGSRTWTALYQSALTADHEGFELCKGSSMLKIELQQVQ